MSDFESQDLAERVDFEMQELPEYSRYPFSETRQPLLTSSLVPHDPGTTTSPRALTFTALPHSKSDTPRSINGAVHSKADIPKGHLESLMIVLKGGIQRIEYVWKDLIAYGESPERRLEKPKVAFKIGNPGLKTAWWHLMVHMVPTAISLATLSLTWRNVFWTDVGGHNFNVILSSLQFAAKAHEILVLMSVSAIVLHTIREHLVGDGVALGLLGSAYRLGGLVSLVRPSFWVGFYSHVSATSPKLSWSWNLPFLLLLATFLTATVGPSSAIVVLPKLDWWPYHMEYTSDLRALPKPRKHMCWH